MLLFVKLCRANYKMTNVQEKVNSHLKSIFLKAVSAVEPTNLILNSVKVENNNIVIKDTKLNLNKPCYIVGFGKAVYKMALTLESILGANLDKGIITVPFGTLDRNSHHNSRLSFIEGAKSNLPDEAAENGAKQIKILAENVQHEDLLIVLISGGGSALLPLPRHPVTLSEKLFVIKELAARGADIRELNCVRKRLSVLKGGGLANFAYPARVVSLILSDVVGDPLDSIASGPTVPNTDDPEAAFRIIQKYSLTDVIPTSVRAVLNQGNIRNEREIEIFARVQNYVIGNNEIAVKAAFEQATALGYRTIVLSTGVTGEVDRISKIYAQIARQVVSLINNSDKTTARENLKLFLETSRADLNISEYAINEIINLDFNSASTSGSKAARKDGVCMIFAGEPTVVVRGNGKGGRNQQLALAFSVEINKLDVGSTNISFLSCGTDGIDGPTDAAGAIGSSNLVNNALKENINPTSFLSNNDSYRFYSFFSSGAFLVKTGHTGTNVMDVHLLIISGSV